MAAGQPLIPGAAAPAAAADRTLQNILTAGQIPIPEYDVSHTIYEYDVESDPLIYVLDHVGHVEGWGQYHYWYEDAQVPEADTVDSSAGVAVGAAVIPVTTPNQFTVRDVIYIRANNAQGIVTNIAAAGITVTWTHAPVAVIANNAIIVVIGNTNEEISQYVIMPTTLEVQLENPFQDIRHAVGQSWRRQFTPDRTQPHDGQRQVNKMVNKHELEKEKTAIFGQAALLPAGITGNAPLATTQGLYYFVATHHTTLAPAAALTRPVLDLFLRGVLITNNKPKQKWVLLCSSLIHEYISNFGIGFQRISFGETGLGFIAMTYQAPFRNQKIAIVTNPLFDYLGYTDLSMLINFGEGGIRYAYHRGLNTKMYTGQQSYGRTAKEKFIMTVMAMEAPWEAGNLGILDGIV